VCDGGTVQVTAHLTEDRLYARNEAAEITFTAQGRGDVHMRFHADAGGRFRERADRVFWSPGGGEAGDVDWPWWSGPVTVTVTGVDSHGCQGEATVAVRMAGDVLAAEWDRGYLFALGSDGRPLGRWKQVSDQGLGAIVALPPARTGGFAAVLRGRGDEQPLRIVRLDAHGSITADFELTDHAVQPLYTDGKEPSHLVWDPRHQEVLADGGNHDRVYRWNARGEFEDAIQIPGNDSTYNDQPVGFGVLGDGTVIVGHENERKLYALTDGGPMLWAEVVAPPQVLASSHDGGIAGCSYEGNDTYYYRYDAQGREAHHEQVYLESVRALAPFRDGYLGGDLLGGRLYYLNADLVIQDDTDLFRQTHSFDDLESVGGFVWLDLPGE
jgi:hypothetical protein